MRVGIGLALLLVAVSATASDHLDSPYIDELPRLDIGDLFVWTGEETNSPVFFISLNPLTGKDKSPDLRLDPEVLYEFKIDTDGDHVADLAYKISIEGKDVQQKAVLRKATGADATSNFVRGMVIGEGKTSVYGGDVNVIKGRKGTLLFVGPRQDPFFFNFKGVLSPVALDLRFALSADNLPSDGSAANTFGPTNITAIALEVPELRGTAFGCWATTSRDGRQEDRCGRASITAIFLPQAPSGRNTFHYPYGEFKQPYNTTRPKDDRDNYYDMFFYRLQQVQAVNADALTNVFLPDIQGYDPNQPLEYPNGRDLEEDAVYWTIKALNPFMLAPNGLPKTNPQKLLKEFPYAAHPVKDWSG